MCFPNLVLRYNLQAGVLGADLGGVATEFRTLYEDMAVTGFQFPDQKSQTEALKKVLSITISLTLTGISEDSLKTTNIIQCTCALLA